MKSKDALGDRMKRYEMEDAQQRLMPQLPIMARLDGRAFHTFTRGLRRPYDVAFSQCMIDTTKALVKDFHATLGYTQSDEITLFFENADPLAQMPFDGRKHKLISLLASRATGAFMRSIQQNLPEKAHIDPTIDCRVWNLPNQIEVYNCFLWRELDATKNSISMAAQARYSPKELHRKGRSELHELLFQKGINWNDYPAFFKRGSYVRRFRKQMLLAEEQLAKMPKNKQEVTCVRTAISCVDMPPLETFPAIEFARIFECAEREDLA